MENVSEVTDIQEKTSWIYQKTASEDIGSKEDIAI